MSSSSASKPYASTCIAALGLNSSGQLGIGSTKIRKENFIPVAFGNHDAVYTSIYSSVDTIVTSMGSISTDEVDDIQCGGYFTIVLLKNGTVYMCGTINGTVYPILTKVSFIIPLKVTQIACGKKHILVLMEKGIVMSWGVGYFGQLGHGDDTSLDNPKVVQFLEPYHLGQRVVAIVCGGSHSGVVTETGRVFMWGFNKHGQCGIGKQIDIVNGPSMVEVGSVSNNFNIVQLVCGRHHSCVLTECNRVYIWGCHTYGRLGVIDAKKSKFSPVEIEFFRNKPLRSLSSGDYHMLALDVTGIVYSWGYGIEGQTGHGHMFHMKTPKKIDFFDNLPVKSVTCGSTWSMAITEKGKLYSWGYGDGGWLGLTIPANMPFLDPDNLTIDESLSVNCTLPSEASAFDSRHNVTVPTKASQFRHMTVDRIRCGGGHSIVFLSVNADATSSSSSSGCADSDNDDSDKFESILKSMSGLNQQEMVSAVHSYCRHRKETEIRCMLHHRLLIDVNARDANGNTPLITACQNGHDGIAQLLLASGVDVNAANIKGNTALHYALAYSFRDIASCLISNGANEYATNTCGLTPYEGISIGDIDSL